MLRPCCRQFWRIDLARRTVRLQTVSLRLRAEGADEAAALFLSRDAVSPTALTSLRSDRARHVSALRELSEGGGSCRSGAGGAGYWRSGDGSGHEVQA